MIVRPWPSTPIDSGGLRVATPDDTGAPKLPPGRRAAERRKPPPGQTATA